MAHEANLDRSQWSVDLPPGFHKGTRFFRIRREKSHGGFRANDRLIPARVDFSSFYPIAVRALNSVQLRSNSSPRLIFGDCFAHDAQK